MPAKRLLVTMECAGNGRSMMQPLPSSTPWRDCAVATAEWLGVPLRTVLEKAQIEENVLEVLFLGGDAGVEGGREVSFARSLPLEEAMHDDVILAYKMNGHPIPLMHGFPVRLIVPGWYGMASVKWLTEIRALSEPYKGYFQKDRYVYATSRNMTDSPVSRIRVKSLILEPSEGAVVKLGKPLKVSGLAWSGSGRIRKVEFRTQETDWTATRLSHDDLGPYAWSRWSINWRPKANGRYVLTSRAFDEVGASQPEDPVWNIHGYGYNSVLSRIVMVI